MTAPPHALAAPLGRSRRLAVLGAVCLAATILPLSFSGGAVATPAIGRALGGASLALTWITNAFMLSFGSLLMAAGALADRYGRKRLFLVGVALFATASTALSLAPSLVAIDALRAMQGVGAAAALAGGTAALAQEFDGMARARAFSLLGTTFGVGLAFGPLLAGALIVHFGWRAVFLVPAAVSLAALLLAARLMRETRAPSAPSFDWLGVTLFTAALCLFTFGVIEAPSWGWGHPGVLAGLAGSAIAAGLFVRVELKLSHPILDLTLFRYPRFVGVQLLPVATCYSYVVLLVLLPLRFIGIDRIDEVAAGLRMLALSAPMLVVPSLAAWLTRWLSPGAISAGGLAVAAVGLVWLGHAAPGTGRSPVLPMLLIGLGSGFPWGLMDGLSVSVVPSGRAGMASGVFSTVRVAGEGLALAIVSATLAGLVRAGFGAGAPPHAAVAIAQALAAGDLAGATAQAPHLPAETLVGRYGQAFRILCEMLAGLTALSAVGVLALLGRPCCPRAEDLAAGAKALTDPMR